MVELLEERGSPFLPIAVRIAADSVIHFLTLERKRLEAGNFQGARIARVQAEVETEGAWELVLGRKGKV